MKTTNFAFRCVKSCRSYSDGDKELWTLTVRLKDLPRSFTYGPNARFATLDKKPAKDMLSTLEHEPDAFVFNNNGIMLVAESIRAHGDTIELVCQEAENDDELPGHGVLNGGHTYKALCEALCHPDQYASALERATVIVTVGLGIPDDEIWRISKARNTSEKVPLHALRELAGDWAPLKQYLPEATKRLIAFKPNDPDAPDAIFDVTDVVRRLALFNNKMFPAQESIHPVAAYTSVGTLVRKYKREDFLALAPLLPDILNLEERIVRFFESHNGQKAKNQEKLGVVSKASGNSDQPMQLLSGYTSSLTLAASYTLPVLAAFRVFAPDGQWKAPIEDLWERCGPKTVVSLWEAYREQGKSSAAVFGRSKGSWAAACELTKAIAIQEGFIRIA